MSLSLLHRTARTKLAAATARRGSENQPRKRSMRSKNNNMQEAPPDSALACHIRPALAIPSVNKSSGFSQMGTSSFAGSPSYTTSSLRRTHKGMTLACLNLPEIWTLRHQNTSQHQSWPGSKSARADLRVCNFATGQRQREAKRARRARPDPFEGRASWLQASLPAMHGTAALSMSPSAPQWVHAHRCIAGMGPRTALTPANACSELGPAGHRPPVRFEARDLRLTSTQ